MSKFKVGDKVVIAATVLVWLTACTATEPVERVCTQYGFSPETGLDSSWAVPCDTARVGLGTKLTAHVAQGG